MRKKISTTIYVTPEQADKLKLLHERTKVPVAVYIREGIDLVLRHYAHLLPGQLPLVDSGTNANGAHPVNGHANGGVGPNETPRPADVLPSVLDSATPSPPAVAPAAVAGKK